MNIVPSMEQNNYVRENLMMGNQSFTTCKCVAYREIFFNKKNKNKSNYYYLDLYLLFSDNLSLNNS